MVSMRPQTMLMGMLVAIGLAVAAPATAQVVGERAPGSQILVPAGADGRTIVEAYLVGVRDIFRETARMLGPAQGPQRQTLITLQNYCSRSLGRLREMANQLDQRPQPGSDQVTRTAQGLYDECRTRYEGFRAG